MENTFFNHLTSNYEMFFAPAGSCQMDGIVSLYNYIMTYLTAILCVVTTALIFIILIHLHGERHLKQFKKEENLEELLNWLKYLQRWTHSTVLELVWTIIPTIILIAIAIPSFILLYSLDEIVDTQSVVKIIGYQWYWKYEYPVMDVSKDDVVTFSYLSYMLPFDDLTNEKNRRLLEVDAPLVLPTNVNSKLVITAKDVLHSFAVPALGLKMDAVPGRLNQITVHIFKSGMFYGQCSELCGVNHGFMPIAVAAVDFNTFEHFLAQCAGVEAQNIEEIEKIEEITTDETDQAVNETSQVAEEVTQVAEEVTQVVEEATQVGEENSQVNTSTEDSKPHPTTDMIADWSRLPICIPCLDDHVYEPYNSIFLDLRELVGKYGWTGTDEQVEFIRPHVKNINAYVINKSDARKDAIERGKDMTDMLSIYCDYRFVPTKCLDDRIKWSEYPNPLKLLFEDMKTSPLFSVPEDAVWEEKK